MATAAPLERQAYPLGFGKPKDVGLGVVKIPAVRSEQNWNLKLAARNVGTPLERVHSEEEVAQIKAVVKIERWWRSGRDRRIFSLLKQAICASEHSLTLEILRKVSPGEAELLKDPALQAKVKFRFGGSVFPPLILFKIFTSTGSITTASCKQGEGSGVHYINGKKMIKPASEAAEDARRQMGNRKFYDQMLQDACHHHQLKITDEIDVTTMKEYMQYVANVDETPAYMGGRDNTWRKLNLDVLPRHSYLHNLVEFLEKAQLRGCISLEKLQSFTRPPTQYEQIEHIKVVASLSDHRGLQASTSSPRGLVPSSSQETSRRSRQAQQRVAKMKQLYGLSSNKGDNDDANRVLHESGQEIGARVSTAGGVTTEGGDDTVVGGGCGDDVGAAQTTGGEEWEEEEVDDLYQWTQELSFDDIR